jgi:hypothetical protein
MLLCLQWRLARWDLQFSKVQQQQQQQQQQQVQESVISMLAEV